MKNLHILQEFPLDHVHTVFSEHRRLTVFHQKGFKCIYCDKIATRLIQHSHNDNSIHVDVFTQDLELFTIDHILSKHNGGADFIGNLEPCCTSCNTKKAQIECQGVPMLDIAFTRTFLPGIGKPVYKSNPTKSHKIYLGKVKKYGFHPKSKMPAVLSIKGKNETWCTLKNIFYMTEVQESVIQKLKQFYINLFNS